MTLDTAELRYKYVTSLWDDETVEADILALCDALDAATARAEAAEGQSKRDEVYMAQLDETVERLMAERDRARGTAAALEAELARLRPEWTVGHSQGIHPGPFTEAAAREWIARDVERDHRRQLTYRGKQRLLRRYVTDWEQQS